MEFLLVSRQYLNNLLDLIGYKYLRGTNFNSFHLWILIVQWIAYKSIKNNYIVNKSGYWTSVHKLSYLVTWHYYCSLLIISLHYGLASGQLFREGTKLIRWKTRMFILTTTYEAEKEFNSLFWFSINSDFQGLCPEVGVHVRCGIGN